MDNGIIILKSYSHVHAMSQSCDYHFTCLCQHTLGIDLLLHISLLITITDMTAFPNTQEQGHIIVVYREDVIFLFVSDNKLVLS